MQFQFIVAIYGRKQLLDTFHIICPYWSLRFHNFRIQIFDAREGNWEKAKQRSRSYVGNPDQIHVFGQEKAVICSENRIFKLSNITDKMENKCLKNLFHVFYKIDQNTNY